MTDTYLEQWMDGMEAKMDGGGNDPDNGMDG